MKKYLLAVFVAAFSLFSWAEGDVEEHDGSGMSETVTPCTGRPNGYSYTSKKYGKIVCKNGKADMQMIDLNKKGNCCLGGSGGGDGRGSGGSGGGGSGGGKGVGSGGSSGIGDGSSAGHGSVGGGGTGGSGGSGSGSGGSGSGSGGTGSGSGGSGSGNGGTGSGGGGIGYVPPSGGQCRLAGGTDDLCPNGVVSIAGGKKACITGRGSNGGIKWGEVIDTESNNYLICDDSCSSGTVRFGTSRSGKTVCKRPMTEDKQDDEKDKKEDKESKDGKESDEGGKDEKDGKESQDGRKDGGNSDNAAILKGMGGILDSLGQMNKTLNNISRQIGNLEKNGKGKSGDGSESGNDKGNGKGAGQGDQDGRGKGEGSGSGSGEGKGNGSESGEATVAGADWGSLNGKQGGFKYQKASRFNEVGQCPMPRQFQFQVLNARGNFAFSYHVICDVALRLRPLLIAFAYIVSASICFGAVVSKSD